MTKMYVAEYPGVAALDADGAVAIFPQPPTASYVVDYTAGAAASPAFQPSTVFIEYAVDSIASVQFGTAPVATTSDMRLAANERRHAGVPKGKSFKISAITNT